MSNTTLYREGTDGQEKEQQIREALIKAMVEHQLPPGSKLPEEALADAFGISRTGIRKVLTRLATVQMVNMTPKKGAYVANPSAEESGMIFKSRTLIELGNLPDVISRLQAKDVTELEEILVQEHRASHDRDMAAAIRYSALFHTRLHAIAGNTVLSEIITNLTLRSSLVIAAWGDQWHQGCNESDHQQLLNALRDKDLMTLSALMQQHFDNIVSRLNFNRKKSPTPDFRKLFSH
ncbi:MULTISPECIES: GntR family transcriptional regulator [Tatumella]|uniref:GntR family transcriptional regulator n=2 Tax=Tatumella ptyseos TaxID=82987 RepID=A0A085JDA8_9GAMM|nr:MULTISPECIES: GntR family transcriptional regulator [Tatumella]KFD18454.1 GntR family transcriptional regulator [Tatumella ptyseos ATCC 33301]SQK74324.1 HTH-type transcriptional regulator mcbR [Tatumella ptyseos]